MTETPGPHGPALRGRVHQNPYLAGGARDVHALLTVDAQASGIAATEAPAPLAAEVIVLDASTSMLSPPDKARAAVDAGIAAIEEMRDGVWFAVLAGTEAARPVWPTNGTLRRADGDTRRAATDALRAAKVGGGTRIGVWLRRASAMLAPYTDAIRHVILLTDGNDEHESRADLDAAIAATRDTMDCDCRGIGADWRFDELHAIASAMQGTVGRVAEPSALAEDFRSMMAASMRKEVAEVALRLWTPVGARVTLVSQSAPAPVDLTARRTDVDAQVGLYPTGAWGAEQRDFHVSIEVPPADPGRTRLAARASFVVLGADGATHPLVQEHVRQRPDGTEETLPEALVSATWTEDPQIDTGRAAAVVRVETEANIAERIRDAMVAADREADEEAHRLLDTARAWAVEIGKDELVAMIDEMYDPETATYRPRAADAADRIDLEIETTRRPPQRGA